MLHRFCSFSPFFEHSFIVGFHQQPNWDMLAAQAIQSLALIIILGVYFSALQAFEYVEASFTIADSVYGSTFFVATGFHGLHVVIGTSYLAICFYRLYICHCSSDHHFGFEAAA
ncbi:Cytochrome c oxidase subunit 3-like 2 [Homarus americanus]|uniref:Cytochrome c oxidase subunit 3 n=1 Tax=Homarus americanus TaxID=6706 RepID=A0A8J5K7K5_HOMAM|nr:Cytochrome c oxidase subunit 3-like 2 [Homarus americanus]